MKVNLHSHNLYYATKYFLVFYNCDFRLQQLHFARNVIVLSRRDARERAMAWFSSFPTPLASISFFPPRRGQSGPGPGGRKSRRKHARARTVGTNIANIFVVVRVLRVYLYLYIFIYTVTCYNTDLCLIL